MSKIKIHFQKEAFLNAQEQFEANNRVLADAIDYFTSTIGTTPGDLVAFKNNLFDYTTEAIKDKHKDAYSLGLSIEKLCELFTYDLSIIKDLHNRYNAQLTEPKETDFTLYAETQPQIRRYKNCEKLIEAWTELNSDLDQPIILKNNPFIQYQEQQTNKPLIVNYNYILNGI